MAALRSPSRERDIQAEPWGWRPVCPGGKACTLRHGARHCRAPRIREAVGSCPAAFALLGSRGASPTVGKQLRVLDPERQAQHANGGSLRLDATNLNAIDRAGANAGERCEHLAAEATVCP